MAARQTRRSISIKGKTYRKFKSVCDRQGTAVSARLEEILAPLIEGVPDPGPDQSYPTVKVVSPEEQDALREAAFSPRFSG